MLLRSTLCCLTLDHSDLVVVLRGGPGNDYRFLLPLKAMDEDGNLEIIGHCFDGR